MARRKPIPKTRYKRYVRPMVIVLGDGSTEESYISRLKELDYFANVHLKFEKGNEENFETKLKEHMSNSHVLVIIDVDNIQSGTNRFDQINRLINTKTYKKQIYFNNYSFETWLLNHKIYFARPVTNQAQYNNDMLYQYGVQSWNSNKNEQNRKKISESISSSDIDFATSNVETMNKKNTFNNPSSNMDEWVKNIKKI